MTSIVILYGVLGVYPKTLGCLFSLYAGYPDYMFRLLLGIHLYTTVTLPIFCEDLMQLKLNFLRGLVSLLPWFQSKGWEFYIDSLCQVLASC